MNKKDEMLKRILDDIHDLNVISGMSGSMFVHGDIDTNTSSVLLKGDTRSINASFNYQMDNNEKYFQTMIAMFTDFLSNNEDAKE